VVAAACKPWPHDRNLLLAANVRAFGVRFNSDARGASCAGGAELRPVLREMPTCRSARVWRVTLATGRMRPKRSATTAGNIAPRRRINPGGCCFSRWGNEKSLPKEA
jgi:hypothetical protein